MADNRNLCEEIEIAIYSDAELTEEQKNHIENCESCNALLLQVSQMKRDLGDLAIPGIEEGQIAKSVMDKIRKEKLSRPLPRFKITHHLGTAAAVVIILAATFIIKNPADAPDNASVNYGDLVAETQDAENINAHMFSAVYDDTESVTESESDTSDGVVEEAPVKFKSVRPESAGTTVSLPEEEAIAEEAPVLMFKAPPPQNSADESENASSYKVAPERNEAALFTDEAFDYSAYDSYASGGGGGSSARSTKIFAPEDFGDDLYENIEIANRIFFELSGIPDYFKAENFESNEDFLKAIENFTFALEN